MDVPPGLGLDGLWAAEPPLIKHHFVLSHPVDNHYSELTLIVKDFTGLINWFYGRLVGCPCIIIIGLKYCEVLPLIG